MEVWGFGGVGVWGCGGVGCRVWGVGCGRVGDLGVYYSCSDVRLNFVLCHLDGTGDAGAELP